MTVKELIDLLTAAPNDLPVFVAYDSMVCVDPPEDIMVVETGEERGVYICAIGGDVGYSISQGDYKGATIIWSSETE